MNKMWGKKSDDGDIEKTITNKNIIEKEPEFIQVVNNKIYFYSEIYRDKVLMLNKNIKELNDILFHKKFIWGLNEVPAIELHINSYGGSIFSGLAVMDEVLNSQIPINTIIDGCCASAATFFSIVGKKRYINKHAFMLIHQLSSAAWGKYAEFVDEMENLNLLMRMIKNIYNRYTKVPMKKLDEILKHDIWFDAETCIKYGLVDEIL